MDALSAVEAAEVLGISRRRVLALIAAGKLPAQKIGSYYVIRRVDLAKVKDRKPGRPRTAKGEGRKK